MRYDESSLLSDTISVLCSSIHAIGLIYYLEEIWHTSSWMEMAYFAYSVSANKIQNDCKFVGIIRIRFLQEVLAPITLDGERCFFMPLVGEFFTLVNA